MSVTQIENDIRETRARVEDEIGAIGEKLRPEHIRQRAQNAVKRKGSTMLRTIKENPVPSAIVALGLALLLKARKGKSTGNERAAHDRTPDSNDEASAITEGTQHAAQQVSEKAKRTGHSLQEFFESNPIIAGAGAIVLGAAVGALIPETEKENRLMGHKRDEMMDKTKSVVQQTEDTIQRKLGEDPSRA